MPFPSPMHESGNRVKSLSRVRLLATPWTAAYQAPSSMGFSRQEYWSGVAIAFAVLTFTIIEISLLLSLKSSVNVGRHAGMIFGH